MTRRRWSTSRIATASGWACSSTICSTWTSSVQASSNSTSPRPTFSRFLSEAIEQAAPYALNFGVGFRLVAPDAPVSAEIDPDRIAQVVTNLLSNAAKFSSPGNDVVVRFAEHGHSVTISVIDHGRGMSPEFRRRLFTRFTQEDRSIERGQAGTGLGLAISKSIVDYHNGSIRVESIMGEGSRFDVTLPRRRPTAAGRSDHL